MSSNKVFECVVKTLDNVDAGVFQLDQEIFGMPMRPDIISRVIRWQLSKARSGNHATKGISQVSGTTRKPYRQKGTGRARQGSLRAPQFRGGGIIFGPVVRSHEHKLNKKFIKLGLKSALSSKYQEGRICIVDKFPEEVYKTSTASKMLKTLNLGSVLFVCDSSEREIIDRGVRNLPNVDTLPEFAANVYDIIRKDHVVFSKNALIKLSERLK
jgi:large subunit ribosomal protein L4